MALPRGISPELLLSQVNNTMPYLFRDSGENPALRDFPPAKTLREFSETIAKDENASLSHYEYFRLCLSAHYLTCGTPVPTDVDNQIRHKLWPKHLPLETALEMASLVLESARWDFTGVSTRYVYGAKGSAFENEALSGHLGEWFTLASAAYCALKQYSSAAAAKKGEELFQAIAQEVNRHSEIFGTLWRAKDGLSSLKASAYVAHNFGDLDRVMDMWALPPGDPLRLQFYKLSAQPFDANGKLRYLGRLWVAGELYKSPIGGSAMAFENHRHFALRKPRCLRTRPEFLIPAGPFFDDWGRRVAEGLRDEGSSEITSDAAEVVEALRHGWERLPKTLGYGRALLGMSEAFPDLRTAELAKLPSQAKFEAQWASEALALMDDIPSRA